jgi:hypothetical protein
MFAFCCSEKLLMTMADIIATQGYREAGYQYVNVDDCWPAPERAANGRLQPDPTRFPSGMKALADYVSLIINLYSRLDWIRKKSFMAFIAAYEKCLNHAYVIVADRV